MDSSDPGTPSSRERIGAKEARRARQQSQRERSKDRKRGGQPGHQGKGLQRDPDPGESKTADPPAADQLLAGVGCRGGHGVADDRPPVLPQDDPAESCYQVLLALAVPPGRKAGPHTTVAVHQVTGLRELGKPGPGQPAWAALMAKMRRKTFIVCAPCHDWIHANPVAHAA